MATKKAVTKKTAPKKTATAKKVAVGSPAKPTGTKSSKGGTREHPWVLQTPPGSSSFEVFRDEALDPLAYPATLALIPAFKSLDRDAAFAASVDAFIDGVSCRCKSRAGKPRRT